MARVKPMIRKPGDIKNGTLYNKGVFVDYGDETDVISLNFYPNEIREDGTGQLSKGFLQWENNKLYIGPGPEDRSSDNSGNLEYNYTKYSVFDTLTGHKSYGSTYNGDGIRVMKTNDGALVHFLGEINGDFSFGKKVRINGRDGEVTSKSIFISENTSRAYPQYPNDLSNRWIKTNMYHDQGLFIGLETFTSGGTYDHGDNNTNYGYRTYSTIDWGSIGFGKSSLIRNVQSSNYITDSQLNDPLFGIYVKGGDGNIYRGYTGWTLSSSLLCFINGIMIGTSTSNLSGAIGQS